jgi:carboxypeptidase D
MLFVGDEDLICNYVGIERMVEAMTWNGAKGLGEVSADTWTVNGTIAGRWTESRNLTYARVFNASHMVGFDVPHVSHDMILRFMGMNFAAISEGSATIPSAVGGKAKPMLAVGNPQKPAVNAGGKTPEQNKAMWEAYYNAGSAALILVLISLAIGVFFFCRSRRRRGGGVRLRPAPPPRDDDYGHEERIPLRQAGLNEANDRAIGDPDGDNSYEGKGKGKAVEEDNTLFEVGSDEEEERRP